ncbi:MAG: NUDIX domain-containing protein [Clostridia bacterium]|nr:NUDIX domain-containing protein [Clostridia bacterium]
MGVLNHKFVLLQDGAAAIILNDKNQILLQRRSDNDKWGLPGGCQELGERFEETVVREIKEETNLDVNENDLVLISVISGNERRKQYPNGDIVFNNTVLYLAKKYTGELKWNKESKVMEFFDFDNLPESQHDSDLIAAYLKSQKGN